MPASVDCILGVQDPRFRLRYVAKRKSEVAKFFLDAGEGLYLLNVSLCCIAAANRAVELESLVALKVLLG